MGCCFSYCPSLSANKSLSGELASNHLENITKNDNSDIITEYSPFEKALPRRNNPVEIYEKTGSNNEIKEKSKTSHMKNFSHFSHKKSLKELVMPPCSKTGSNNEIKEKFKTSRMQYKKSLNEIIMPPCSMAYLRTPVTYKKSSARQNLNFNVGSSCMQGWRREMEDDHVHILDISNNDMVKLQISTTPRERTYSYFAVFDGHSGKHTARYLAKNLHLRIINTPEFKNGIIEQAIIKGVMNCDSKMLKDGIANGSGSTGVFALLNETDLYVGNVGDSRIIASINGKAKPLSFDHKPFEENEKRRIYKAGSFVRNNRVRGQLAVSRAFGDFEYKCNASISPRYQEVTAYPDIFKHKIEHNWEFIFLACDGIWDVLTNQQVVDMVVQRIANKVEPKDICEKIMDICLTSQESVRRLPIPVGWGAGYDNMTAILVCFLHNQPFLSLVGKCKQLLSDDVSNLKDP